MIFAQIFSVTIGCLGLGPVPRLFFIINMNSSVLIAKLFTLKNASLVYTHRSGRDPPLITKTTVTEERVQASSRMLSSRATKNGRDLSSIEWTVEK